jgi:hypothetical protein
MRDRGLETRARTVLEIRFNRGVGLLSMTYRGRLRRSVGLIVGTAALALPASAVAGTITVNTGSDNATSASECQGVAGDCSLRQAIDKANAGDTIAIPASLPTLTLTSFVTLAKNVTIAGSGPAKNKIDGQLSAGLFSVNPGVTTTISGLTLTRATGPHGAALGAANGANVTLTNDVFANNVSGGSNTDGFGVIDIAGSAASSLTIASCAFTDNNVGGGGSSGGGFGVIDFDPAGAGSELKITNSTFTGNVVGGGGGSGFGTVSYSASGSGDALTVDSSNFSDNHVGAGSGTIGFGGGIEASDTGGGSMTITNSTFGSNVLGGDGGSTNNSGAGFGGGIDASFSGAGRFMLDRSTFSANRIGGTGGTGFNSGGGFGGGLSLSAGPTTTATISRSTFSAQRVGGDGGSGMNSGGSFGTAIELSNFASGPAAVLVNDTITGNVGGGAAGPGLNSGGGFGGGVLLGFGPATFVNDTIDGNQLAAGGLGAGLEGEMATQPSVILKNTILAANTAGSTASNCGSVFTSQGHNISTTPASQCGLTASGDIIGDPHLGVLANRGGPTETQALLGGPAVNGGGNAGCPATDERGVPRPQQGACDIGAYEVAPPVPSTGSTSHLRPTSARLRGSVINADVQAGTASFEYGTSTKYGLATSAETVPATKTITVSIPVARLKPHTRYHYRLISTNPDGSIAGADRTFLTPAAKLTKLKLHPRRFKASKGATISYMLNVASRVTFTILNAKGKQLRSFRHKSKAGANRLHLTARGLKPGSYRLRASAGAGSKPVTVSFRIF